MYLKELDFGEKYWLRKKEKNNLATAVRSTQICQANPWGVSGTKRFVLNWRVYRPEILFSNFDFLIDSKVENRLKNFLKLDAKSKLGISTQNLNFDSKSVWISQLCFYSEELKF